MKFSDLLREKALTLCFLGMGLLFVLTALLYANVNPWLLIFGFLLLIILVVLWLLCEFLRYRARFKSLLLHLEALDEKYLLGELLPVPKSCTERRYFEIMRTVSHSAIGAVEKAERDKEDYKSFVEQWIHELKTPLTACSLILANGGDARKIKRELKRADNLTESVLYYARLRSAEKDRVITSVLSSRVINEALQSQMELLTAADIGVSVFGDCTLRTDSKALCFMLKQLLVNCAKYCPGCKVEITAENGSITVTDNGPGIPKSELLRVCDRGFTGTNGRKIGNSTGMGLFLVKELCEQLGIKMEITSKEGEFTKIALITM